jgi:DNA-binding response OmpR family regulator
MKTHSDEDPLPTKKSLPTEDPLSPNDSLSHEYLLPPKGPTPDDDSFQIIITIRRGAAENPENPRPASGISFETNDLLRIESSLLWVNGKRITLDKRETILVALLTEHALEVDDGTKSQFMPKLDLVNRIESDYGKQWRDPVDHDIDQAVASLRRKFAKHGISRDLIETRRLVGLRLSTPPWNIRWIS